MQFLIAVAFIAVFGGLFRFLWKYREELVFAPDRVIYPLFPEEKFQVFPVWAGEKDRSVHGWFVRPSQLKSNRVMLICPGTKGNLTTPFRVDLVRALSLLGMEFLIFDYRGTGLSPGRISQKGLFEDTLTAWEYLERTLEIDPERIIVFGRSLGGPVAAYLASERDPFLLVLESTFPDLSTEVSSLFPFLTDSVSSRIFHGMYETRKYLDSVQCPVVFLHGDSDRLVSYGLGRKLYRDSEVNRKIFVTMKGLGHKGFSSDPASYAEAIEKGFRASGALLLVRHAWRLTWW